MRPASTAPVAGSSATMRKLPVLPLKTTAAAVTSLRSRNSCIVLRSGAVPVTVTVVLTSLRVGQRTLGVVVTVYGKLASTSEPENT